MNKFLRKHNKAILAVAMSLLLVVWLGGSALTSFLAPDFSGILVAKTSIGDIVEGDKKRASFETDILSSLGLQWQLPAFAANAYVATEPISIMEWILLTREAERAGMIPQQVEVEQFLSGIGRPLSMIYDMANQRRVKPELIFETVAKYRGVAMLAASTMPSASISEASIRTMAEQELEKATVNLVSLKAADFVNDEETVTDADIQAHFQEYRETQPGPGIQFGYYRPARVKVQYLKVDIDKVAENVVLREQTLERKAREFWRQNPEDSAFARPLEDVAMDKAVIDELKASGDWNDDADDKVATHFETFDDARDAAIQIVKRDEARKKIQDVADWLTRELAVPWFDRETDDDGYKPAPDGVMPRTYYSKVLEGMPSNLQFGGAVTIHETDWFDKEEAILVEDIGDARVANAAMSSRRFRDLAFLVQGIETVPTESRRVNTSLFLAVGQSCVFPLRDNVGNYYVYRITDVKPPGPAEELADVREKVIDGVRLMRAYERCKGHAERVLAAAGDGLKAAYDADEEIKAVVSAITKPASMGQSSGYYASRPFGRVPAFSAGTDRVGFKQFVNGVGQVEREFIEDCFALGSKPAGERRAVREVPELGAITVIEWAELAPMYKPDYEKERARIVNSARRTLQSRVMTEWFSPQRIRERHAFEMVEVQ